MITLITSAAILLAQGGFAPVPQGHTLFGPQVEAWAISDMFFEAVWPSAGAPIAGPNLVPQPIWEDYQEWVRRIIKTEYVPSDLKARTTAYRGYHENDVLAVRYRKDGWDVQIIETTGEINLTLRAVDGAALSLPTSAEVVATFVKSMMTRFLNMSSAEIANAQINHISFRLANGSHFSSFVVEPRTPWELLPKWWMVAQGFTDGRALFLAMAKSTGVPSEFGAASPATGDSRIRFLPGG
jgi:hypothetical protein